MMADILIRGMEMPQERPVWVAIFPDGQIFEWNKAYSTATAIPLPEGHGRLGDLDKLEENLRLMAAYQTGERQQGILGCCETIRMTKPIVPAEGGGEDA